MKNNIFYTLRSSDAKMTKINMLETKMLKMYIRSFQKKRKKKRSKAKIVKLISKSNYLE